MKFIEDLKIALDAKDLGHCLELLDQTPDHILSSPEIQFLTGRVLIEAGRNSEALVHLEYAANAVSLDAVDDVLQVARVLLSCGGDSASKHLLSKLLSTQDPSSFSFTQLEGITDLYLIMESPEEALTILSSCYSLYENQNNFLEFLELLGKAFAHNDSIWEELEVYLLGLKIEPFNTRLHHSISRALSKLSLFDDANTHLEFIEKLDPDFKRKAIALDYFQACKSGSFDMQERLKKQWLQDPEAEQESRGPFAALIATDDPAFILLQNQLFSDNLYLDKNKTRATVVPIDFRAEQPRIRIAYLSPDFGNHAVCHLITDLIGHHNRADFDVSGFAISHPDDSEYRQAIAKNFESFFAMEHESTVNIARKVKSLNVDIVIDLAGYTKGFRSTLFHRLDNAILVSYLGYPSTTGHKQYHYVLGDQIVTPEGCDPFFSEKVIRLNCCYQANSPSRHVSEISFKDTQLPDDVFVFCNFNTRQKLNMESLLAWREILTRCGESILWLLDPGESMQREISSLMKGVESRIFFAPKLKIDQHLGRIKHAHLFLDNFPYGAHTTASDAVFQGIPIISRSGRAFQSRVSKSIMAHAGVDNLDADNWDDFIALACDYYSHYSDASAAAIKRTLLDHSKDGHPYNIKFTTACIENAFKAMLLK